MPLIDTLEPRLLLAIPPLPAGTPPIVRVAYVIPANRDPQPDGVRNLQSSLPLMRDWYADQMARNGFVGLSGGKTFVYETEPDGLTPKIHVVEVPETDAYLRGDIWTRVNTAATAAGVPLWTAGQVWLLVSEIHTQLANGDIEGGVALGASNGSGRDAGVAQIGTNSLPFLNPDALKDTRPYAGQIIPEIGPYPLVQDVSYAWFEGNTFSSIASTYMGAILHEISHAFGLPHDFRNDNNMDGNLMGNGFRGFRNAVYPDLFPADAAYLQHGQALMLNTSRYLNRAAAPETTRPTLSITTSGAVTPVNGQIRINFTASDASGLSAAALMRDGEQVAELRLSGTSANTFIATPYYDAGATDTFKLMVYDVHGNRRDAEVSITPATGVNRAPRPFINATRTTVALGETMTLTSTSTDPDGNPMTYEWDLDGDGVFETAGGSANARAVSFNVPTAHRIYARVTDSLGASAVSAPLSVRVLPLLRGSTASETWLLRRAQDGPNLHVYNSANPPAGPPMLSIGPNAAGPLRIDASGGADQLILDYSYGHPTLPGGITFDGGPGGDTLSIINASQVHAEYRPSGTALNAGQLDLNMIGTSTIDFANTDRLSLTNLASLTYITPRSDDTLSISTSTPFPNPTITGSSGGITVTPLSVANVPIVTFDLATNDTLPGGTGADRLVVSAAAGLDTLRIDTGPTTAHPEANVVRVHPGADTRLVALRPDTLAVSAEPGAAFSLPPGQHLRSLTLAGKASVTVDPADDTLRLSALTIDVTASLDVTDNDLVLSATPATRDALFARITDHVRQSLIVSSLSLSDPDTGLAVFNSAPDPNAVLVKYTWNGDADGSGVIDLDDYFAIDSNFLNPPANPTYAQGDFNYDGDINLDDYFLIDSAFLAQTAPLASASASTAEGPLDTPDPRRRTARRIRSRLRR